ncbi:MAG: class I SAM-dependent rRNA methyltransferase [Saprospiraceae bacterium]
MLSNFPDLTPNRLAIKVKPSIEKIIRKGHPWLFEAGITKQSGEGQAGDLSIIYDNKKNKLLAIGLYDPFSPIRLKVIQFNKGAKIDENWFAEKIKTAFDKRESLLKTDTNSYRLINGENDGLPSFIADVYADVLVVKLYSLIWLPYIKVIFPLLLAQTGCKTLVLRLSRNVQKESDLLHGLADGQVIHGVLKSEVVIFREHGVLFSANVIHGHKTGYFLDHRENRRKVGQISKNKTVLDIFSYAGGFSVHALAGGAKEVTSLDISAQALEVAQQNALLNLKKPNHKIIVADAFKAMQELIDQKKQFDIVVIDPPSFAKRETERSKALHHYRQLAALGANLIAQNGILVLASCSSRVSATDFFDVSIEALDRSNRKYKELERTTHDVDHPIGFPEGAYLKCGYFQF